MRRLLLAILLLFFAQPGWGVYITDKLLAGFYTLPDSAAEPLRALPSGTPLEVLERGQGFSRVRLGDNSEGWVENRFITAEKPAKVRLLELQARNAELQRTREPPATGNLPPPDAPELERLRQENAQLRQTIARASALLDGNPVAVTGVAANDAGKRPPLWLAPLLLLVTLIGFIGGIAFKNYRIARRARRASKMKF